ncbi:Tautomerase MIF [Coniophora puteana RWD-64-598 SS2]|uniref:L-dopachrome isomerase n=1 Tax=Coniophora puteana (strain RWD-64-598) TaxID=741705 RepID=A0A5M3MM82_CONPW|nr:Tautomerase MIF [Coniophora puteana RWD-64-598 SS2]EIW79884.1 Tautomerase MIF [Coniophora puteana RWD-64-598 SS2]
MPLCTFITNVKIEDTRKFAVELTEFISQQVEKPVAFISMHIKYDPDFYFAGSFDEPACRLHVDNLWNNTPEAAIKWSAAYASFFQTKLGIAQDRYHVAFEDSGPDYIGAFGSTAEANRLAALKQGQ